MPSNSQTFIRVKSLENVAEVAENEEIATEESKEETVIEKLDKTSPRDENETEKTIEEVNHYCAQNFNSSKLELTAIPHRKGIKLWNLMRIKRKGYIFYRELALKFNSSLFKLRMNTDRILINDYKSIGVMYDTECVRKDEGFGFMNYNSLMLKNYVPAIFSNGMEHEMKKETAMRYIEFAFSSLNLDEIVNMVNVEFKNMPEFENLTVRQAKRIDFEDIFDKAVGNVITKILLGSSIDHKLLEEWLSKTLEFEYGVDLTDEDEKKVTDKVFEKVQSCPHIKKLPTIVSSTKLSVFNALREVIWMTTFNAFGGTKSFVISSLISFLTLSKKNKDLICEEADRFLSKESHCFQDLYTLKYLNSFFLEVARLYPPAATVYGRTTKDLIIDSTTGKYFISKDNLLCGNLMAVHRDPNLFSNPEEFSLQRPADIVTQNNYTFGGRFHRKPEKHNHKCPGKDLAEIVVKLFTIFITKCIIIPTERPQFTGRNMGRFEGSDRPLKVITFRYLGK